MAPTSKTRGLFPSSICGHVLAPGFELRLPAVAGNLPVLNETQTKKSNFIKLGVD